MPLDHYVSQVHLRHFYSPAFDNRMMHAMRKSDLQRFPCKSEDVCRIEDGSTNAYLSHDRAVEDFLPDVERNYNAAIVKLRERVVDRDCVYVVAGFAAYVASCAPAAMRVHSLPLRKIVEATAMTLDRHGRIPPAPEELGGRSLTELFNDGTVRASVDQKYPQALGINSIIARLSVWGNSFWEVLHNGHDESPFFTSDFPVVIEARKFDASNIWIVPLAPDLAVRIIPNIKLTRDEPDLSFSKLCYRHRSLKHTEVIRINRLIVRCAEELIFFRDERDWIAPFISDNRHYRVEAVTDRIPLERGWMHLFAQRIVPHERTIPT
jgi:hypothetical protein